MKSKQQIKRLLIVCTIMVLGLIQLASAQSWNINGNAGINSRINYLGTSDNYDLVFRTNAIERGRLLGVGGTWHFGSATDYAEIDSLGKLSFSGKGDYMVGRNRYVFRYSKNKKYGLFFNFAADQYEFRDGNANPVFSVNYNTGVGTLTGDAVIHGITVGLGGNADYSNTAVGESALFSNTTGNNNTAIGSKALFANTIGFSNTAIGSKALFSNTIGKYNNANGSYALYFNTTGISNVATGTETLYYNTTGNENTAYGTSALLNNVIGNSNTAIGIGALSLNSTGNNNTALGAFADIALMPGIQNAMALGCYAEVNASNKVQVGNSSVTVIGGQVGWSTFSDGRFKKNIKQNVPGLEFINKLNPVTYTLEIKKFDRFLGKKDSMINSKESQEGYAVGEKKIRTGFIAQEVEKTAQEIGYDFDGVNHPQNDKDNYSLVYADFVPSLVKSVQELSAENAFLQKQIDELKTLVANLAQGKNGSSTESENKISLSSISLEQNIPNPLANSTSIGYFIPSNISNAQLIVTDMSGKNIKQISLQNGKGNITIDASTLSAGAYNYSLMVNGKVVATKRMVVSH